jgi:2-phospho-L-lactate guanylyltransferase (CobY/MobA/RfbA family)
LSGIGLDSLFAMATFVVPYKRNGKTRLGDSALAWAMYLDVEAACAPLGDVVLCDAPGGQSEAVAAALLGMQGPVAIVNADVPSVTTTELEQLLAAAPALVAAADGTTNALALSDARDFRPLYGPGSAERFGLRALDLAGLRDDVDTREDLMRIVDRVGPNTRRALEVRV